MPAKHLPVPKHIIYISNKAIAIKAKTKSLLTKSHNFKVLNFS